MFAGQLFHRRGTEGIWGMCLCLKRCFGYIRHFFFFFSIFSRPNPCLHLSFCVNGNALTAIWCSATQLASDPSLGVRKRKSDAGKSPGKAHLKEELIAVSFTWDESCFTLHLVNSSRRRRQPFSYFSPTSWNICLLFSFILRAINHCSSWFLGFCLCFFVIISIQSKKVKSHFCKQHGVLQPTFPRAPH